MKMRLRIKSKDGVETIEEYNGVADFSTLKREMLNYGCRCKTDHGKTRCGKEIVEVKLLEEALL